MLHHILCISTEERAATTFGLAIWTKGLHIFCIFSIILHKISEFHCVPLYGWDCVCVCVCVSKSDKERARQTKTSTIVFPPTPWICILLHLSCCKHVGTFATWPLSFPWLILRSTVPYCKRPRPYTGYAQGVIHKKKTVMTLLCSYGKAFKVNVRTSVTCHVGL